MSKAADCSSLAQKRPQAVHVADFGKCKISQEGGEWLVSILTFPPTLDLDKDLNIRRSQRSL